MKKVERGRVRSLIFMRDQYKNGFLSFPPASLLISEKWGYLDSNQEPTSYEPAALTVELYPLISILVTNENSEFVFVTSIDTISKSWQPITCSIASRSLLKNPNGSYIFCFFSFFDTYNGSKTIRAKTKLFSHRFIHIRIEVIGNFFQKNSITNSRVRGACFKTAKGTFANCIHNTFFGKFTVNLPV